MCHAVLLQFLELMDKFKTCWQLEVVDNAQSLNCSSQYQAVPSFRLKQFLENCTVHSPAVLIQILLLMAGVEPNPGPWTPPTHNTLMPVVKPRNMCFHISLCQMLRYFFKGYSFQLPSDQESHWLKTMFMTDNQVHCLYALWCQLSTVFTTGTQLDIHEYFLFVSRH